MNVSEKTRLRAERAGRWLNRLALISPKVAGRMAFKIFCTPLGGRLREKDRQFLATADNHLFLEVDGQKIACYEWGNSNKPTVCFVHGWESNAARWRYFIREAVKKGFRVVAFDAPGQGNSTGRMLNLHLFMRTFAGVIAHFGQPKVMVGHSLGGGAIMQALHKTDMPRPEKVVIIGTFNHTTAIFQNFKNLLKMDETVFSAMKNEAFRRTGRTVEEFSNSHAVIENHDIEALFLHDTDDDVVPISEGRENAAAWPGARYVETVGLGHKMQHRTVVEAVVNFMKEPYLSAEFPDFKTNERLVRLHAAMKF